MGHGGPGEVQSHHHGLLQGRRGRHRGVRHHQAGDLQQRGEVGEGREEQHQQQGHRHHARGQQVRQGQGEDGAARKCKGLRKKQ